MTRSGSEGYLEPVVADYTTRARAERLALDIRQYRLCASREVDRVVTGNRAAIARARHGP
jgi:hypothetical protein